MTYSSFQALFIFVWLLPLSKFETKLNVHSLLQKRQKHNIHTGLVQMNVQQCES